jgi:DNA-directed RNA polymerase specialized sigma24 family protein
MNSVALPASATTSASSHALGAEADLVRQAGRGDAESFGELYRRHSAPAWRLAQAVTEDSDSAVSAFKDGFVRGGRTARRAGTAFRPHVLSTVYRTAIDQSSDRAAGPARARRAASGDPDAALADAAFRSLPERWRAAVWLRDVENFDSDRIAAVLGVSATVAEQLISRGRRGLAGRFAQAHRDVPEHVGDVLRPLVLAVPASLPELTSARWSSAGTDHLPIFAPITGWLENRALRPMSVAVGALVGLGLIGLGVVPGGSTVRGQLGAVGNGNLSGAVPVRTCMGLACPGAPGASQAGSFQALSLGSLGSGGFTNSGAGSAGGTGSTFGANSGGTNGGGASGGGLNGGGGATNPASGGGNPLNPVNPVTPSLPSTPTLPVTLPTQLPGPVPPPAPSGGGTTVVPILGVGAVTITGGSTLPTLGVNVLGTNVPLPAASSSSSTTSTTTPLQGVTSTVTKTLGGL